MSWKDLFLYGSTMTASALSAADLYTRFSEYVIKTPASTTPIPVKVELGVFLTISLVAAGFSFKKTFEILALILDRTSIPNPS